MLHRLTGHRLHPCAHNIQARVHILVELHQEIHAIVLRRLPLQLLGEFHARLLRNGQQVRGENEAVRVIERRRRRIQSPCTQLEDTQITCRRKLELLGGNQNLRRLRHTSTL